MRACLMPILFFVSITSAIAAPKESTVAGWHVSIEKDPFGSDDRVIVIKEIGTNAIGFRCFSKRPQIVIVDANIFRRGEFTARKIYEVKLRTDDKPILPGVGIGVSSNLLQIETIATDIYSQAAAGQELAIRVESDGSYANFRLPLKGAKKALAEFYRACSISPE